MSHENVQVLIADDVRVVRELHKSMLREFGFRNFFDADNGEDAIELASSRKIEMAILDIDMPIFTGLEVLSELRKLHREIFIVIVSGEGTTGNVKAALDLGVDGFLVKPYTRRKVEDIVNKFAAQY